jgi:hypothetical protein
MDAPWERKKNAEEEKDAGRDQQQQKSSIQGAEEGWSGFCMGF